MSNQIIQMTVLIIAIIVLTYRGIMAQKKVKNDEDMSVGGRSFNAWTIFFTLFAFWGGNTIASIVELAHKDGIAGGWFGITRVVMFVLILFITGGAFRSLSTVTLSDFISKRFESPFLRLLSGIIIALNFTLFVVSSVVGAQAFFTVILGWPLGISVIFTVVSFLVYTTMGGMHALSANAKIITIGQISALIIAVVMGVKMAGWNNIMQLEPRYFSVMPKNYPGTVLMWLFTFIVNAFVAQAALQIVMACRTIKEGQKGVIYTMIGFIPIIVLAPLAGLAAKVLYPTIKSVQAMPMLASNVPTAILSSIVVVGLYFTTLGWASSCILSGGTVAANDIYRYFVPNATSQQLIKVSRISIVILGLLTVGFAILIPSGVEYWTIVGFVLRNTGLFPLILIGLFWKLISRKSAIVAALAGSGTGIVWYLIKFPAFLFDAHPMFVGMIVSIIIVVFGTLLEYRGRMKFASSGKGTIFAIMTVTGTIFTIVSATKLIEMKLLAASIIFTMMFFLCAVLFLIKRVDEDQLSINLEPAK